MTIDYLIIHAGLPKTATTALQKYLLPRLNNCTLRGRAVGEYPESWLPLISQDENSREKKFAELLNTYSQADASKYILLSEERLCFSFMYPDRRNYLSQYINRVGGRSVLIVTLREQFALLKSWYLQGKEYQKFGCGEYDQLAKSNKTLFVDSMSYEKWIDALIDLHKSRLPGLLNLLCYSEWYEANRSQSKEEAIELWVFEWIRVCPDIWSSTVSKRLGISADTVSEAMKNKVNETGHRFRDSRVGQFVIDSVSRTFGEQAVDKIRNYKFVKTLRPLVLRMTKKSLSRNPDVSINMRPDQFRYLRSVFAESNRSLVQMTGIDLGRFNYRMPSN